MYIRSTKMINGVDKADTKTTEMLRRGLAGLEYLSEDCQVNSRGLNRAINQAQTVHRSTSITSYLPALNRHRASFLNRLARSGSAYDTISLSIRERQHPNCSLTRSLAV